MEDYVSPAEQGIIDAEAITEEDELREWAKSGGVNDCQISDEHYFMLFGKLAVLHKIGGVDK